MKEIDLDNLNDQPLLELLETLEGMSDTLDEMDGDLNENG